MRSLVGTAADGLSADELAAVVALPAGLAACGRTEISVNSPLGPPRAVQPESVS